MQLRLDVRQPRLGPIALRLERPILQRQGLQVLLKAIARLLRDAQLALQGGLLPQEGRLPLRGGRACGGRRRLRLLQLRVKDTDGVAELFVLAFRRCGPSGHRDALVLLPLKRPAGLLLRFLELSHPGGQLLQRLGGHPIGTAEATEALQRPLLVLAELPHLGLQADQSNLSLLGLIAEAVQLHLQLRLLSDMLRRAIRERKRGRRGGPSVGEDGSR
eukprot:scaffold23_cov268-Pinguiococcus_pyrenoidosus.AAC.18